MLEIISCANLYLVGMPVIGWSIKAGGTSAPSGVLQATYYLSDLQSRVSQYFHVILFLLLHVLSDLV